MCGGCGVCGGRIVYATGLKEDDMGKAQVGISSVSTVLTIPFRKGDFVWGRG